MTETPPDATTTVTPTNGTNGSAEGPTTEASLDGEREDAEREDGERGGDSGESGDDGERNGGGRGDGGDREDADRDGRR